MKTTYAFLPPAFGHVNPALPYLAEWARRGNPVTCFCTEPFQSVIEAAGLTFVPLDSCMRRDYSGISTNMYQFAEWIIGDTQAIVPHLESLDLPKPDLVIHDGLALWGHLYARIHDVPSACTVATFAFRSWDMIAAPRMMWRLLKMIPPGIPYFVRSAKMSRDLYKRYGVVVPPGPRAMYLYENLNFVFTSKRLQPWSKFHGERFKFVGPSIADRPHAPAMPEVPSDIPLVYVALGTLFNDRPEFYEEVLKAFSDLPVHVLLSAGSPEAVERLGEIPKNCTAVPSAPQLEVLQKAALFVTHGGMNSMNEGLYHGVPLLVVPQMAEQRYVGRRVVSVGAGLFCDPRKATATALRSRAQRLLEEPQFKAAAHALSLTLRATGGPKRAADETEAYLARGGRPGV